MSMHYAGISDLEVKRLQHIETSLAHVILHDLLIQVSRGLLIN